MTDTPEVEEYIPDDSEHLEEQHNALVEEESHYAELEKAILNLDHKGPNNISPRQIEWQQNEIDNLAKNKVSVFALYWNLLEASDIDVDENIKAVCDAIRNGKIGFLGIDLTDCPNNQYRLNILDALQNENSSVVSIQLKGFIEPQLTDQLDVINDTEVTKVFEKIKETMSIYDSPIRWTFDDVNFTADNMSDLYRTAGNPRNAIGMLEFPNDITEEWYKHQGGADVIDRIRFGNSAFFNLFNHIRTKGPSMLLNYREDLNEHLCSDNAWQEQYKIGVSSGCLGLIAIINMSESQQRSKTAISTWQKSIGKNTPKCLRRHYNIPDYEKPHQTNAERLHLF